MKEKCREIEEKFPLLYHNRIEDRERGEVLLHLAACSSCRKELKITFSMLKMLEEEVEIKQFSPEGEKLESKIVLLIVDGVKRRADRFVNSLFYNLDIARLI